MNSEQKKSQKSMLMTEGVIWKQLILYSLPLLIGNLFQQLYNTVDSIVVGRYIGSGALAAVGSSSALINLIIGMFMGIAVGAGVIVSQYYGAGSADKMGWAVHTSIILSVIGGVFLTVAGVFLTPFLLKWMKTPQDVLPDAILYLRIFFLGSVFNLVYNMGAGILQAVGDSKRPLYYLCISSVVNIVLDIYFVRGLSMGVEGVAFATIISQLVAAVLTIAAIMRSDDIYRLELKKLKLDVRMMKRVLKLGLPSGVQQSVISLSNVIVQANVNMFGAIAMAGFGAYNKIDGFVMLPFQSFCLAATTFAGQNIGAGKTERVRQGMKQGLIICLICTVVLSVVMYFKTGGILEIFSKDAGVIHYGLVTMKILMPFYVVISIHQVLIGTLRGAGKSMQTMLISVGNMCVLRVLYIYFLVPYFPSFEAVMWGYPITWVTTVLMDYFYMKSGKWLMSGEQKKEK